MFGRWFVYILSLGHLCLTVESFAPLARLLLLLFVSFSFHFLLLIHFLSGLIIFSRGLSRFCSEQVVERRGTRA